MSWASSYHATMAPPAPSDTIRGKDVETPGVFISAPFSTHSAEAETDHSRSESTKAKWRTHRMVHLQAAELDSGKKD
jgi:hypothetical protein